MLVVSSFVHAGRRLLTKRSATARVFVRRRPRHTSSLRFRYDAASQRADRKHPRPTDVGSSLVAGRRWFGGAWCRLRRRGVGTGQPSRGDRASCGIGHGALDAPGDRDGGVRQGGVRLSSGLARRRFGDVVLVRPQPPLCCRTRSTITRAFATHPGGKALGSEIGLLAQSALEAPDALGDLVELATGDSSFKELSDAASAAKCAARSKESARLRRARVQRARHLRWRQDQGGGVRGEFLCDEVAWARVGPIHKVKAKARAKAAGGDEDSLVRIASTPSWSSSGHRPIRSQRRPAPCAGRGRRGRPPAWLAQSGRALRDRRHRFSLRRGGDRAARRGHGTLRHQIGP